MMSHVAFNGLAGGTMLLLLAAATGAEAQTPGTQSRTSVVQRLAPDSAAPTLTGRTRELKCRGKPGIDMRVHRDPSPRQPDHVTMVLRYERLKETRAMSYEGMVSVDRGRSLQWQPGGCTWMNGDPDAPTEPGIVYFDLPRDAQAHATRATRDTTVDAAVYFPDPVSLPRYLSDSSRYWLFFVDDATNESISFGRYPLAGGPGPRFLSADGSVLDASASLSSAHVMTGDSAARRPTVLRTPAATRAGVTTRDKASAGTTLSSSRLIASDTTVRAGAVVRQPTRTPTPAPAPVAGPLRPESPATASTTASGALPTDSAARRTASVRTPLPDGSAAGPLREPGTATPSTSRVMPTDTAARIPDDARARTPSVAARRLSNVRTAPGPLGVVITFYVTGLPLFNPHNHVRVEIEFEPPAWNERERRWAYPTGLGGHWFAKVDGAREGGLQAVPWHKLEQGRRYHYLITAFATAELPEDQRTGTFVADIRTSLGDLFSK